MLLLGFRIKPEYFEDLGVFVYNGVDLLHLNTLVPITMPATSNVSLTTPKTRTSITGPQRVAFPELSFLEATGFATWRGTRQPLEWQRIAAYVMIGHKVCSLRVS